MPVRVLHVAETLPGGIATYLNHLLPWQLQHYGEGHVALVAPAEHLDHLSLEARAGLKIFPFLRKNRGPMAWLRLLAALHRALRGVAPSIIHAQGSFAGAVVRASPFARKAAPIIYCAHGWSFDMGQSRWRQALYAWIERRLAPRAARIIAISDYEKDSAVRRGIAAARMHRIYNGLHDMPLRARSAQRASGPWRLLFVGRINEQKGLDWLLNVVAGLPPGTVELTVAGATINGAQASLPQLAGVHYAGWVAHDQLNELYDRADAVIMPSRWEGFGLVAAEAMRRSIPLLVSNRGALPEVIGHGEAGKIFSLDAPDQLQLLLQSLQADELQRLGHQGRERFLRLFTAERMNTQVHHLYNDVLSEVA